MSYNVGDRVQVSEDLGFEEGHPLEGATGTVFKVGEDDGSLEYAIFGPLYGVRLDEESVTPELEALFNDGPVPEDWDIRNVFLTEGEFSALVTA